MKEYVAGRFRREEEDISREEMLLGNEIANLLKKYLSHAGLIPKGLMPQGKGSEEVEDGRASREKKESKEESEPEKKSEYEKLHTSTKTYRPIRRVVKTTYGISKSERETPRPLGVG